MSDQSATPPESDRARNTGGEFVTTREPSQVYEVMDPLEPYSTSEIATVLGWPRRTMFDVLDQLAGEGKVRKKKPNERRVIWIRPPEAEAPA